MKELLNLRPALTVLVFICATVIAKAQPQTDVDEDPEDKPIVEAKVTLTQYDFCQSDKSKLKYLHPRKGITVIRVWTDQETARLMDSSKHLKGQAAKAKFLEFFASDGDYGDWCRPELRDSRTRWEAGLFPTDRTEVCREQMVYGEIIRACFKRRSDDWYIYALIVYPSLMSTDFERQVMPRVEKHHARALKRFN